MVKERGSNRFSRRKFMGGLVQQALNLVFLAVAMGIFAVSLDGTGEFAYYVV
jgi:hypothetical protein